MGRMTDHQEPPTPPDADPRDKALRELIAAQQRSADGFAFLALISAVAFFAEVLMLSWDSAADVAARRLPVGLP
jgi:hypothetical protein